MSIDVTFAFADQTRSVCLASGTLITDAAEQAGVVLNMPCGGKGSCGGCVVNLVAGSYECNGDTITASQESPQRVLGCKTSIVGGPARIDVPRRSLVESGEKVVADYVSEAIETLNPSVQIVELQLDHPSLEDDTDDVQRIATALHARGYQGAITATMSAMHAMARIMVPAKWQVQVVVAAVDHGWTIMDVRPAGTTTPVYGMAVDIGTTTVVVALVNMLTGEVIDTASRYNQQIQLADDVASRILHAGTPEGLRELREMVVQHTIVPLTRMLCKAHSTSCNDIVRIVLSGNTVMAHLLLGIDPTNIGAVPFQPVCNRFGSVPASTFGLNLHDDAIADIVPSISGYVGGDIVSDLAVCNVERFDKPWLLIDVGTNGEIVLYDGTRRVCTACAAGPAFEGPKLASGMRASQGAIETVRIDDDTLDVTYSVIGGGKPLGMCGSALIDAVAELHRLEIISQAGRFADDSRYSDSGRAGTTEVDGQAIKHFVIAHADETDEGLTPIVLTEKDIEMLMQAKGAIFAGIHVLTQQVGLSYDDLEIIFLAGGFAKHVNIDNAIRMGMLPDTGRDKFRVIGNGSLAGAVRALLERTTLERFDSLRGGVETVHLNLDDSFNDQFMFAMFLPNMQEELFPSVT